MRFLLCGQIIFVVALLVLSTCGRKEQPSVRIGDQRWMASNLDVISFSTGETLMDASSVELWNQALQMQIPAYSRIEKDSVQGLSPVILYNWFAVSDPRGLCPKGWNVPTDTDWSAMVSQLGEHPARRLKSNANWLEPGIGSNELDFNALPVGFIGEEGVHKGLNQVANWWSLTQYDDYSVWFRYLTSSNHSVGRFGVSKSSGLAVRCVFY